MIESLIYIASPYSDINPEVMQERFEKVCRFAGQMMAAGHLVYSPIAHSHNISLHFDLPKTWKFWSDFDLQMLNGSEKMVVLQLPGWQRSVGVRAEIEFMTNLGRRIEYADYAY